MKCFVCVFFSIFSITGVHALTLDVGTAEFDATATGGMRIHGEGGKVEGTLTESNGKLAGDLLVKLDEFSTGSGLYALRNSHMRDYLETKKHPTSKFVFKNVDAANGTKDFEGELTIKGVTKTVKGTLKIESDAKAKKARAEFSINLSDFDISIPVYFNVTVNQKVKVLVDLKAS